MPAMAVMASRFTPAPPSSIPGCQLYLNGDLGVTVATGVSNWADQSGSGNDVSQGTGANQPAQVTNWRNGKNAIQGASGKSLGRATPAVTISQPMTIFAIGGMSSAATSDLMFQGGAGGLDVRTTGAGDRKLNITAGSTNANFAGFSALTTDQAFVFSAIVNGASSSGRLLPDGGAPQIGNASANPGSTAITAGIYAGNDSSSSLPWLSKYASFAAFNRALNLSENLMVESWYKAYYAITTA